MKFDVELLLNILWIATICQVIALVTTQKFKTLKLVTKAWQVILFSFVLNVVLAICFCTTFTDLKLILSLWVGFFSFVGADTIYNLLADKGLLKGLTEVSLEKKEGE